MSTTNNFQNDVECVLISDEEEDPIAIPVRPPTKRTTSLDYNNDATKKETNLVNDRSASVSTDENDGRRKSRRRTQKVEDAKANEQKSSEQSNDNSTTKANSAGVNNSEKKVNENRAETRSRKRERSASPVNAEVKEVDPIPFKEILTGLEGAAFQSR